MLLRFLILLMIVAPASAQMPDSRAIAFSTQDRNGLHMITVTSRAPEASVRLISSTARGEPRNEPYPLERFDAMWQSLMALDLSAYENHDPKANVGVADNFVIVAMVGTGTRGYLVPKCNAPNGVRTFVDELTLGLVPAGSPGLFKPCAQGVAPAESQ